MRLIDANKIESILMYTEFDRDHKAPWLENEVEAYRHFLWIIQSAETEIDVDKIIERLRHIQIKSNSSEFDHGIDKAIEVIKIMTKR